MRVNINYGVPFVTLGFEARADDGEIYVVQMHVALDAIGGSSYTTPVSVGPERAGATRIQRVRGDAAESATEGTITLTRDAGADAFTATVTTPDAKFTSTARGEYSMSCAVPGRMIGKQDNEGILEFDWQFTSDFCKPFKSL